MTTTHFSKNGTDKAACGSTGCWVKVTYGTFLVDCVRCERNKEFKAAREKEAAQEGLSR